MPDTVTFSALVDEVAAILARGTFNTIARNQIVGYARSTLKECHALGFFKRDFTEDQITATATPHIWTRPTDLRKLTLVEYPYLTYPVFIAPGRIKDDLTYYYYMAATYYVFVGVAIGDIIKLGYFSKGRKFVYYPATSRPAIYDDETGVWSYLDVNGQFQTTLGSEALDELARDKVTDWLLTDWYEVIMEGTLAKVLKAYNDPRAASTFAVFRDMKDNLTSNEAFEGLEI